MDAIEEYFQGEYINEKNRIREIDEILKKVIKTFSIYGNTSGDEHGEFSTFPYEIGDKLIHCGKNFSCSTNSMILYVLDRLLQNNPKSPLTPNIVWEIDWKKLVKSNEQKKESKGFKKLVEIDLKKIISELIKKCNAELKDGHIVSSKSYGYDDPFSLSWIAELISTNNTDFGTIIEPFVSISLDKINKAFSSPENPILEVDGKTRKTTNHIFPLLRVIHLYKTLVKHECWGVKNEALEKIIKDIDDNIHLKLTENLHNRINQQISYSLVQNSLFDTAELVLSIEGLLLIDDKKKIDENLLTKAFDILKANQEYNLSWRPLKPFVTSPQGDILLPLSIEIANSLLRVCKYLEVDNKFYFHRYFYIFEKYTKWLLSNISHCNLNDEEFLGWRSEHIQNPNVIHPWETAQVVIYLMNYKDMLHNAIAYKSLKKSGLACDEKYVIRNEGKTDDVLKKEWFAKEPMKGTQKKYQSICKDFVDCRLEDKKEKKYSMLLYGPPGTGKSTVAESIAEILRWPLITITPSDFIRHGESDIEGRAKVIFKTLEEQKNSVILFDEIDRLILDRDSSYYDRQSDMFQFMTPSMLVKIKDLRTKERSIFIIATNYEERIDSAIKRAGRIDEKYLINPPDLLQRESILMDRVKKKTGKSLSNLQNIAAETVYYTFGELKTLVNHADLIEEDSPEEIFKKLVQTLHIEEEPTIKLSNYKRRIQEYESTISIFPYKEFLFLFYLKLEVKSKIEQKEHDLLIEIGTKDNLEKNLKHDEFPEVYEAINEYLQKK